MMWNRWIVFSLFLDNVMLLTMLLTTKFNSVICFLNLIIYLKQNLYIT
jgi:hypothetical protein